MTRKHRKLHEWIINLKKNVERLITAASNCSNKMADNGVKLKETEKKAKYLDLAWELK